MSTDPSSRIAKVLKAAQITVTAKEKELASLKDDLRCSDTSDAVNARSAYEEAKEALAKARQDVARLQKELEEAKRVAKKKEGRQHG